MMERQTGCVYALADKQLGRKRLIKFLVSGPLNLF
jgi:hypothetical protein